MGGRAIPPSSFIVSFLIYLKVRLLTNSKRMKNTFLDYYKMILDKVSFDGDLLAKEYAKALNILNQDEARTLEHWVKSRGFKTAMISDSNSSRSIKKHYERL